MESLADILSGADTPVSADPENTPEPAKAEATDVKTEVSKEAAAAAPSAAKTIETKAEEVKADAKTEDVADERTRDDKGRFAKADELASLRAGMQEERRKRQEAERKLKEQDAKIREEAPKKDFWEDPDAALEERLTPREEAIRREAESRYFNLCEDLAKRDHKDYDEVVTELLTEAQEDAALGSQVFAQAKAARNPAEFLYTYAMNRRELKAVGGDLGKYKESVAAEYKPKLTALETRISALEAENKQLKTQLDNVGKVPSSLNAEPSAARADVLKESLEHESLEEITKRPKRRA